MNLTIQVSPPKIAKFLFGIIFALVGMSLLTEIIGHFWDNKIFEFFSDIFNVGTERNIPTLFSVLLLWTAAFLCALITFIKKETKERYMIQWGLLALIFLLLGWDEGVQLHDALTNTVLANNLSAMAGIKKQGVFAFNWVVVAIPAVFLLGLFYLKFMGSFVLKQKQVLVISAITYVMGALGMEMISAWISDTMGENTLIYILTSTSEDLLEMSGVVIFIYFLLIHLNSCLDRVELNFVKREKTIQSVQLENLMNEH